VPKTLSHEGASEAVVLEAVEGATGEAEVLPIAVVVLLTAVLP